MTTQEFQFPSFNTTEQANQSQTGFTKFQQDQIYSLIQKELTRGILNLQESISKYNFAYDAKMMSKFQSIEIKLKEIGEKLAIISDSTNVLNIKITKIDDLSNNISKIKDQITSQEIRLNNTTKDLGEACYKYDKMYLDNLILPGQIGECCKFKNLREFLDFCVNQFGQFEIFKAKNIVDLKSYKEKIELLIGRFNKQFENFNKASYDFTNLKVAETKEYINEIIANINSRFPELKIENSNYFLDIKNEIKNLIKERENLKEFKLDVTKLLDANFRKVQDSNNETSSKIGEYKTEFAKIKRNFIDIAEFIKDVRFKKNINNEISSAQLKKLSNSLIKDNNYNFSQEKVDSIHNIKVDELIEDITVKDNYTPHKIKRNQSAQSLCSLSPREKKASKLTKIYEEEANLPNNNSNSRSEDSSNSMSNTESDKDMCITNLKEINIIDNIKNKSETVSNSSNKKLTSHPNFQITTGGVGYSDSKQNEHKSKSSNLPKIKGFNGNKLNNSNSETFIKKNQLIQHLLEKNEKRLNDIELNTKLKLIEIENKLNTYIPCNTNPQESNRNDIEQSEHIATSPNRKKDILMTQTPINLIMNNNYGEHLSSTNFKNYLNFHPSKIRTKQKQYSFSKIPNDPNRIHLFEMRSGSGESEDKIKKGIKRNNKSIMTIPVSKILSFDKDNNNISNTGITSNLSSHFLKPLKNCLENIPQINPLKNNN